MFIYLANDIPRLSQLIQASRAVRSEVFHWREAVTYIVTDTVKYTVTNIGIFTVTITITVTVTVTDTDTVIVTATWNRLQYLEYTTVPGVH